MKRFVGILLTVIAMLCVLTACGKETFSCALCMKKVTEKPHVEEILGKEVKICDSCYSYFD